MLARRSKLNPESDRAWFQKARADDSRGDLTEALDALNQAISLNPRASSYYYVLARLYRRLGRQEESQEALATFERLERETEELEKRRREVSRGRRVRSGTGRMSRRWTSRRPRHAAGFCRPWGARRRRC